MKEQSDSQAGNSRKLALNVIYDIFENKAYTNISLDKKLKGSSLNQTDRNLVTELVNGTVRMVKHLDWVLNLFLQKPIEKMNPWIKNILRMSVYQILFMDKIPDYAIVNTAVNMSRKKVGKGLSGVVNGVLRRIIASPERIIYPVPAGSIDYYAVFYSLPVFLVQSVIEQWGQEKAEEIFKYWNERARVSLRCNQLKTEPLELQAKLQKEKVVTQLSSFYSGALAIEKISIGFDNLKAFHEGLFYIQNESSMLAAHILNPQPGERIYDLCCGVGGKTTHFAEIMKNQGEISAYDLYDHKIELLKHNCRRLGIHIVKGEARDLLSFNPDRKADKVYLDAPCSGWGVLSRRADSRWSQTEEAIAELNHLQALLLQKAGELVDNGGTLVYSTCTINRSENEQQVDQFLKNHPDFMIEGFAETLNMAGLDAIDQNQAATGMLTLLPGKYRTDGMFYAKIKRK